MLSYTSEVLAALLEEYALAIWPAEIVATGLALLALALTIYPVAAAGRVIAGLLAAAWAWTGAVFHGVYFASINFAAPAFAALFLVQALLFAWTGVMRGRLAFRFRPDLSGWAGMGLAAAALLISPPAGLAPTSTTLLTFALLLLGEPRTPLHLVATPLLWAVIAGASAWFLGIWHDVALLAAGLGAAALIAAKTRRGGGSRPSVP